MDIKEFLRAYPEICVASAADNAEILLFFARTRLRGRELGIRYDRSPNFFAFLDLHSPDYLVLIYRNQMNEIQGVATFIFRKAWIGGHKADVCYLGDLRIGADRGASKMWRKIYGDIVARKSEITQFQRSQKFYTCLIDENKMSSKSLARNKKSGFAYHPVSPYSMITLLMPKFSKTRSRLKASAAESLEELQKFYRQNEAAIPTGYLYSEEIPKRLREWPELSLSDFLTVREGEEILASAALWSPRASKKICLTGLSLPLRVLARFNSELKVLYVTHLVFRQGLGPKDKTKAFAKMLEMAWRLRREKRYHFVSFCDFHRASLKEAAAGFFMNEVKMCVYEVTAANQTGIVVETENVPDAQRIYGFEMALV